MLELIGNHTFNLVLLGTTLFGMTSAIIGTFTFVRRQSLLGDVISHTTLPGIVLACYLTESKHWFYMCMGGSFSALCGMSLITYTKRHTTLKQDAILGIILSVFFGFGLVCLSWLQRITHTSQTLVSKLIFGNASTIMMQDIYGIAIISIITLSLILLFWKECMLIAIDPIYARIAGYPILWLELLLNILTIACIMTGLQLIGVILMSTSLVAPAAAAAQWAKSFKHMLLLSVIISTGSCMLGTSISACIAHVPTGPVIAFISSLCVFGSLTYRYFRKHV